MRICISSGHSTECQGAVGILNEVAEATRVVDQLAINLRDRGVEVWTYHDTVSTTQNENLNRIVDWHNSQTRDLDVSVHFNASDNHQGHGVEVLYYSQYELSAKISAAIAKAGQLTDRGAKQNKGLFFLANTECDAVLLEVAFCDHANDCQLYTKNFLRICEAIADVLAGDGENEKVEPPAEEEAAFYAIGKCSSFGGPDDLGVAPSEGLAFFDNFMDAPHLFLPYQPEGTTGLARRLNPYVHYLACRWNYDVTPKEMLTYRLALVRVPSTGLAMAAFCADWGPHEESTGGRVADLSPGLMADLGLETDDEVEIVFPYPDRAL